MIVPLVENEDMYTAASEQSGYVMPRYRETPMMGGNFWGRIVGFAKGLFSKVAPHISNLVTEAQPHVKRLAGKAIDSAIDNAVEGVTYIKTQRRTEEEKKCWKKFEENEQNQIIKMSFITSGSEQGMLTENQLFYVPPTITER